MPQLTVRCPNCKTHQPDEGRGNTCGNCGYSPLPSYQYPKNHAFYPRPPKPTMDELVRDRIARKKATGL